MIEAIQKKYIFFDFALSCLLEAEALNFPRIISFGKKQDTAHYIVFQKEIIFIQVVILGKDWNQKNNIKMLAKDLKKSKIYKKYIKKIHKIIQFQLVLFENEDESIRSESSFMYDKNLPVPYKIIRINLTRCAS